MTVYLTPNKGTKRGITFQVYNTITGEIVATRYNGELITDSKIADKIALDFDLKINKFIHAVRTTPIAR